MISRLKKAGFKEVGFWSIEDNRPQYTLTREETTYNVLYAFVAGTEVLYIGKTTIALRDRMYQYQRPGVSQRTNVRVNGLIADMLSLGDDIRIYALPDPGDMKYYGFHLNLAAGLEDDVISQLRPKWNKVGNYVLGE